MDSLAKFLGVLFGQFIHTYRSGSIPREEPHGSPTHHQSTVDAHAHDLPQPVPTTSPRVDVSCQCEMSLVGLQHEISVLKKSIHERDRLQTSDPLSFLVDSHDCRVIRALHLRPNPTNDLPSFDLKSLSAVCRRLQGLVIDVTTIAPSEFLKSHFVNWQSLRKRFDVVFIGGTDSSYLLLKDLTEKVVNESFVRYHQEGGNVVFFHDVLRLTDIPYQWTYFQHEIGFCTQGSHCARYQSVKRLYAADERTAVLMRPFRIPEPFNVGLTHAAQACQAEKAVLIGGDNPGQTYYVESEGIAVCETGHSPQSVTDSEWEFLVNVTCHLAATRPRADLD
jgi:hypothetical protein